MEDRATALPVHPMMNGANQRFNTPPHSGQQSLGFYRVLALIPR